MKKLMNEYGFSIFVIISGIIMIGLFYGLIKDSNIYSNIVSNSNIEPTIIEYEKDLIQRIEANDQVIYSLEDLEYVIDNIEAYSLHNKISKDNIYTKTKEIEKNNYEIDILVKYNGDFMTKKINCYLWEEENENVV